MSSGQIIGIIGFVVLVLLIVSSVK
ncbi:MAG: hypothetical protein FD127_3301, partial [Acidimicrobiaceae bacterium]